MNNDNRRTSFLLKALRSMAFPFLLVWLAVGGFAQEKENGQPTGNDLTDAFANPDDGLEPKTDEEEETPPSEPEPANQPIAEQPVIETNAKPTPTRWSEWNRGATVDTDSPPAVQPAETPLLGSYYLAFRPNLHVAQDIDLNGIPAGSGEIETETGIGIGFELGRYLDDWEMLLSVGYDRTPLGNLTLLGTHYQGDGSVSAYHFMVGGARRFNLGDKYVLRGSVLLGMANRHDHYKISALAPYSLEEEGMQPTASLEMLFDYKVSETLTLSGGYGLRFLGNADRFSNIVAHSIELGGVWNL
jgi:hypothetical protein